MRILLSVAATLALSACISIPPVAPSTASSRAVKSSPAEVAARCIYDKDEYRKVEAVRSPEYRLNINRGFPYDYQTASYGLAAGKGIGESAIAVQYQINVTATRDGDWMFLDSAVDSHGNVVKLSTVDRNVTGAAWIREDVRLELTREYLERHRVIGLDIKLYGDRGEFVLQVPPSIVAGFLLAVDKQWPQTPG